MTKEKQQGENKNKQKIHNGTFFVEQQNIGIFRGNNTHIKYDPLGEKGYLKKYKQKVHTHTHTVRYENLRSIEKISV